MQFQPVKVDSYTDNTVASADERLLEAPLRGSGLTGFTCELPHEANCNYHRQRHGFSDDENPEQEIIAACSVKHLSGKADCSSTGDGRYQHDQPLDGAEQSQPEPVCQERVKDGR